MILKLSHYSIQKEFIKNWLDSRPDWIYENEVGPIAVASHTHIVAVSHFIGQLYGYTDNIKNKIIRDMKFHNVDEVDLTSE